MPAADSQSQAPALRAAGLAALLVAGVAAAVIATTGRLGYAIDDPYIHLALADGLVEHGTFGIRPGVYESASSSPLWTLALAAGRLTPVPATWLPLLVTGTCSVAVAWLLVRRLPAGPDGPAVALGTMAIPITVGLAPLALTGMEHAAHVLVVLAVVQLVADDERPRRRWTIPLLLAVGTGLRFETAFVAAGIAVVRWRRRSSTAGAVRLIASELAPVVAVIVAVAAVNLGFGQGLLPNSIVAKAALDGSLVPNPADALRRLFDDPLLLVLVALVAAIAVAEWRRPASRLLVDAATIVLVATSAHLLWADVGWFARYQAYLVVLAAWVVLLARSLASDHRLATAAAWVLVAAVAPRALLLVQTPSAAAEIHRAHEQIGRFLVEQRPGEAVALHDIGYPAFLGAGPIIDLFGLADHENLELRRDGALTREAVTDRLEREGAELMVVFERPFGHLVPEGWVRVEQWCLDERVLLFDECFAFFADPAAAEEIEAQLDAFAGSLPAEVERRPG